MELNDPRDSRLKTDSQGGLVRVRLDEEEEEVKTEEPSLKENKLMREGAMIETQEEKRKNKREGYFQECNKIKENGQFNVISRTKIQKYKKLPRNIYKIYYKYTSPRLCE